MKLTIISGSHRINSQSEKVAKVIKDTVETQKLFKNVEIFSLAGNPLPLWDQGVWDGDEKWKDLLDPLKLRLSQSDAFVIVSPEWHGQVPAGLKNFFLLCSKKELGHKPAAIVTVSNGDGGSYPVAELRMSSYKNNRICYIPEHVIIRKVEKILNDNQNDNDPRSDKFYRERLAWVLEILKEYASAFRQIRASGATDSDIFKNGM